MAGPCPRAYESAYVWSHVGCGTLTGDGLTKYILNNTNEWQIQSFVKLNGLKLKMKPKIKVNQSQNQ